MTGRNIPEPIKRQVRQASFFGCIICGMPIYHYEHINNFALVKEHTPENIVLLCPNHHQEKTSGRLSQQYIRRWQSAPRNSECDKTSSYPVLICGEVSNLNIGGNIFEFDLKELGDRFEAIIIQNKSVLSLEFQNGFLLLDLKLTDRGGRDILVVDKGELSVNTGVWDYTLEGQILTIRSHSEEIELRINFGDDGINIQRGFIVYPPYGIDISPGEIRFLPGNNRMIRNKITNCKVGIRI